MYMALKISGRLKEFAQLTWMNYVDEIVTKEENSQDEMGSDEMGSDECQWTK